MNTRISLLLLIFLMATGNTVQSQSRYTLSSDDVNSVNANMRKSNEEVEKREAVMRKAGAYIPMKDGSKGIVGHTPDTTTNENQYNRQSANATDLTVQRAEAKYHDKLFREAMSNNDLSRASSLAVTGQQQRMVDEALNNHYANKYRASSASSQNQSNQLSPNKMSGGVGNSNSYPTYSSYPTSSSSSSSNSSNGSSNARTISSNPASNSPKIVGSSSSTVEGRVVSTGTQLSDGTTIYRANNKTTVCKLGNCQ